MIEASYLLKIFNASPLPSLLLLADSPHFTIEQANTAYLNTSGKSADELAGKGIFETFKNYLTDHSIPGMEALLSSFQTVVATGISDKIYTQCYYSSNKNLGEFDQQYLNIENIAILDNEKKVAYILHTATPVIESWYNHELEHLERDILEMSTKKDYTTREVICSFMQGIEKIHPGMICSMQEKKGNQLFNLASPSLPKGFLECIRGIEIGNNVGACGTAAYLKKQIICCDIENDIRWEKYRDITNRFQLKACFSTPVIDSDGNVIATFAAYFRSKKTPTTHEENTIQRARHIIQIIFERSLKEEAINASEERYRSIMIASPDEIAITDLQGRVLMVSPSAVDKLAFAKEEDLVGRLITDFIIPEDRERAGSKIAQMSAGILSGPSDYQGLRYDGTSFDIEANAEFIRDAEGKPMQIVFIIRDISERKRAEKALQESELRYKALVEWSPDAIGVYRNGKVIYCNPAGIKMFGAKSPDEIIGISVLDIVHPDFQQASLDRMKAIIETKEQLQLAEMKFLKLDGNSIDVEVQSTLIVYDNEPAIQTTVRDITKRKQEEQHLRLLESVITHANDAVLITEAYPTEAPGPRIIYVNDAFTKMTGYHSEEVIGKTPRILHGPKTNVNESSRLGAALKNWQPCEITQINYKKNGEEFWVHLSISPVIDEKGQYTHWISIQRDVTAIKDEELRNTLFTEISSLFNDQSSLGIALKRVMNKLKIFGDFVLAESWLVDSNKKTINLVATSPLTPISRLFYEETAHINRLEKGEGLPGITWQSGTHQFWQDIQIESDFIRKEAAKKTGIQSFCSLPIITNNEVIGVLVLGSAMDETLSDKFSIILKNLGIHIGDEIRRKQLEHELVQIFNFAPDIICISDFEGYFKKVNPAACKLLEYSEEELKAVPHTEFVHPEDKDKTGKEITSLSNGIANYYFENRYVTKSGKIKWLAWTASPSPAEGIIFGVAKDITEKKTLENFLAKVNKLARIGGWELDLVKNSLYWSNITKAIHEVKDEFEPNLETAINFYLEEDRALVVRCVEEGIAKGKEWDVELQILTAKGNICWIRSMGEAEFLNGKCIRIYGSFQDIDSRKKVELALQHNIKMLEDYKFALDESAIISITDEKGIILTANDNFCKISKYQKHELEGNSHWLVNAGFHSKDFFKEFWQTIQSGKIWRGEIKNKTKYGEYYWVYATVIPFLDAYKKPFQYLAIRFDITEKKIADEAIRISNERYNLVAKATNDAIWDWNLETNQVVRAGEGLEKLFGYSPAEADKNDHFWNDRTHPDDFERWQKKLKETANEPSANYWEDEYRFRKADGIYAIVSEKGYIMRNPMGKAIRIIGATQDITKLRENEIHLKELNENLQQKAKELADSNAELEQFAFVASHDLQEPLRMVTGFLTQLERKYSASIDDTGKKYINFAVDGAKRMRQIILDLLEFSRLGRKEGHKENLDLNHLIAEIKILLQKNITEKKAIITSDELPSIHAYKTPILQVFQNLIGNALKYSKSGVQVKIQISVTELKDHWQFSISDNGIGIGKEYFDRIFVIFQRLHNKDEFSGTGIGLAITKKVIENHEGKIWLTSEEEKGSTFYFTIKKELE